MSIEIVLEAGPSIEIVLNEIEIVVESIVESSIVIEQQGSTVIQSGAGDLVYGEVLTGVLDGFNATFTTTHSFIPGKLRPQISGVDLTIVDDFQTIGSTTVQFVTAPHVGEKVTADYTKA